MAISENLLEIRDYTGEGYQPLIDYQSWRVAILRYHEELLPDNINALQRHNETDEVFVLLAGHCMLFLGDGEESITAIHAIDMQPLKLYNIKRGVWHSHTLSKDATVLIIENRDTTPENSPLISLSTEQKNRLIQLVKE